MVQCIQPDVDLFQLSNGGGDESNCGQVTAPVKADPVGKILQIFGIGFISQKSTLGTKNSRSDSLQIR